MLIVGEALTVIFTEALFVVSVTDVDVMLAGPAPLLDAVNVAVVAFWFDRLPGPFSLQVTPAFAESFVTEAVN